YVRVTGIYPGAIHRTNATDCTTLLQGSGASWFPAGFSGVRAAHDGNILPRHPLPQRECCTLCPLHLARRFGGRSWAFRRSLILARALRELLQNLVEILLLIGCQERSDLRVSGLAKLLDLHPFVVLGQRRTVRNHLCLRTHILVNGPDFALL